MRGHCGKKIVQKSRNSCWVNGGGVGAHRQLTQGGGVGAHGQLTLGAHLRNPGTKYNRSKNSFSHIYCARLRAHLGSTVTTVTASCVVSNREGFWYTCHSHTHSHTNKCSSLSIALWQSFLSLNHYVSSGTRNRSICATSCQNPQSHRHRHRHSHSHRFLFLSYSHFFPASTK